MTDQETFNKRSHKKSFQGKEVAGRGLLHSGFVEQLGYRLTDKEWKMTKVSQLELKSTC